MSFSKTRRSASGESQISNSSNTLPLGDCARQTMTQLHSYSNHPYKAEKQVIQFLWQDILGKSDARLESFLYQLVISFHARVQIFHWGVLKTFFFLINISSSYFTESSTDNFL